jgi:hypothetical protein
VDQADRLRAVYGVDGRPKKWWRRLFWGILDMAFVNSYVIFSDIREKMSLLEYRRSVAMGLKKKGCSIKTSFKMVYLQNITLLQRCQKLFPGISPSATLD